MWLPFRGEEIGTMNQTTGQLKADDRAGGAGSHRPAALDRGWQLRAMGVIKLGERL